MFVLLCGKHGAEKRKLPRQPVATHDDFVSEAILPRGEQASSSGAFLPIIHMADTQHIEGHKSYKNESLTARNESPLIGHALLFGRGRKKSRPVVSFQILRGLRRFVPACGAL
jgi:hypothetical protein